MAYYRVASPLSLRPSCDPFATLATLLRPCFLRISLLSRPRRVARVARIPPLLSFSSIKKRRRAKERVRIRERCGGRDPCDPCDPARHDLRTHWSLTHHPVAAPRPAPLRKPLYP